MGPGSPPCSRGKIVWSCTVQEPAACQQSYTPAFSGAQTAVLLVLLLLLVSIPIWTNQLPPLSDYANHLARMHVIATINKDPDLALFYEIDWQIIPNLMMDLTIPLLAPVVPIYHAGQIFLVATFALIMSGALALNRALFGRWSCSRLWRSRFFTTTSSSLGW